MVTQYGMSEELGLGTFERPRSALFLNGPGSGEREYGEDTARMIDVEVRRLLEAAHLRVQTTLKERRSALEMLAKVLIEREVVDRDALTALLAAHEP
jgi:cell division protease FtsH